MNGSKSLLQPQDCAALFVDLQAGLAFGVESAGRQTVINNAIALARTTQVFRCRLLYPPLQLEFIADPCFLHCKQLCPELNL